MTVIEKHKVDNVIQIGTESEKKTTTRAAFAVIFNEDLTEVLLFRYGPMARIKEGPYYLPGGRLEDGENFPQAAKREIEEETGLVINEGALLEMPGSLHYGDVPLKDGTPDMSKWMVYVATAPLRESYEETKEGQTVRKVVSEVIVAPKEGEKDPFVLNLKEVVRDAKKFIERRRALK